jgi:hypothetical protein
LTILSYLQSNNEEGIQIHYSEMETNGSGSSAFAMDASLCFRHSERLTIALNPLLPHSIFDELNLVVLKMSRTS